MSKNTEIKEYDIPFSLSQIYNKECNELLFHFHFPLSWKLIQKLVYFKL
jgi:hypothetical protein